MGSTGESRCQEGGDLKPERSGSRHRAGAGIRRTGMMRGTFPDTNRLSLVPQRRFHTAWDEMRGSRVQIVPTVARELTTNVIVDFPQASEPVLAEEAMRETPGSRRRLRLESDLWWTRQWLDSQSNYHLHRLTDSGIVEFIPGAKHPLRCLNKSLFVHFFSAPVCAGHSCTASMHLRPGSSFPSGSANQIDLDLDIEIECRPRPIRGDDSGLLANRQGQARAIAERQASLPRCRP